MKPEAAARLLELNRQFYEAHAASFSATRGRANPGAARLLEALPPDAAVLDLGCGNGSAAAFLADRGHRGNYLGLDASPGLLTAARQRDLPAQFVFQEADLTGDWHAQLPAAGFDFILCFAVLHHLPGSELQAGLLQAARAALASDGSLFLSVWQFRNSPKLAARVQPWESIGLSPADLDAGDALLDWRAEDQSGLRYVHHFSLEELESLAAETGYAVQDTFLADGETGDLGLYSVWQPAPPAV